jgi:hypothetical protein
MAIIGTLPNNLTNGTTADASQVIADLNFIVNQVNANAQPAGSYLLPGTDVTVKTLTTNGSNASGDVLVKSTGVVAAVRLFPNNLTSGPIMQADSSLASGGGWGVTNYGNTAYLISVDGAGNLTASGVIRGTDITGTSDRRLKSRIKRIRNATEVVLSWVGVTFQRKGDKSKRRHAGFIANDFEKSTPDLVYEDEKGIKSIAYGNTSAYLAEAFKELEARVRRLEDGK